MELVAFRLANYETPLWAVENFFPGRYNRAGSGWAQYLSLHPLAPWAELLRSEGRRTRAEALQMRYPLWAIRAELDVPPRELTFDTAPGHGLPAASLVADDMTACQDLADAFRRDGTPAFLAPSAALPGTRSLVLLDPKVATSWEAEPVDELDLPASMAAQDGRCPENLWDLVHHRGARSPHPALAAWEQGEPFAFEEPLVTRETLATS
jgi:RES domain